MSGSTWRGRIWALVCARDEQDSEIKEKEHTMYTSTTSAGAMRGREDHISACEHSAAGPAETCRVKMSVMDCPCRAKDRRRKTRAVVHLRPAVDDVLLLDTMHNPPCVSFSSSFSILSCVLLTHFTVGIVDFSQEVFSFFPGRHCCSPLLQARWIYMTDSVTDLLGLFFFL